MPLLHITLVEVHRVYEKLNMAAKDMAEAYKRAMAVANRLQEQCANEQANNADLLAKLQQTKERLKEVEDRLQAKQLPNRSQELDQKLGERLREIEKKVDDATDRANQAEQRVQQLEDRIMLAKTGICKWLDAKDHPIQ